MPDFRIAQPADLQMVDTMLRRLAQDLNDPYRATLDALSRALFSDAPTCFALLAEHEGRPCGLGLAAPVFSTLRGGCGVYVSDLWVSDDTRGQGIGAGILSGIAGHAASVWQAVFLKLAVYNDNTRAKRFYENLGFDTIMGEAVMAIDIETLIQRGTI